jgi:RimJ/RimL family protein N-acetyltransferase
LDNGSRHSNSSQSEVSRARQEPIRRIRPEYLRRSTGAKRRKLLSKGLAVVRKVRAADRKDILEISSKTWGGHDYLPFVLDEWLKNPKCHTYGVEVDSQLVAIGNLRLVDRNRTGWMEGLRVHPDYRKRGYADMLTHNFLNLGSALKVQQLRYTTGGNNRISLKLARKTGFKRKLKMTTFWHENLDKTLKPTRLSSSVTEITPLEAHKLLRTNKPLVPYNILIYDWKAINGTLQAFKEIGKDHIFYSTMKRDKLEALSFGHERPDSDRHRWSFTVYAPSEKELITHFRTHVNNARVNKDITATVCTCPTQFETVFKEHEQVPKPNWKMQLILLEKQMHTVL